MKEIKTVQDIFDIVTVENLDRFMLDFYKVFHQAAEIKEGLDEKTLKGLTMPSFNWIDDDKNDVTWNLIERK